MLTELTNPDSLQQKQKNAMEKNNASSFDNVQAGLQES